MLSIESDMVSMKSREGSVKASIPRQLYLAIVKVQAAEELDWEDACVRASELLDLNGEEFKRAVKRKAQSIYKSRFMRELNKARKTIEGEVADRVRWVEDNFHVPCNICRKPMRFSSRDENWMEVRTVLYGAFRNWRHTSCVETS